MSGYQRFLPRDGTRTTAHAAAEAAEVAEVKAIRGLRAAEALLKPAEVRPGDRQVQQASAEVQHRQRTGTPELQQLQQLQQAPAPRIDQMLVGGPGSHPAPDGGAAQLGIPTQWSGGVLRLGAMPPPRHYPERAWQRLIVDAGRFLDGWATQAHCFGWPAWELFGCHRRTPWGRVQGMGLVLLLRGDEIAALTATEAAIRTGTGARQTYRRKPCDPLHSADRCLVWELVGER